MFIEDNTVCTDACVLARQSCNSGCVVTQPFNVTKCQRGCPRIYDECMSVCGVENCKESCNIAVPFCEAACEDTMYTVWGYDARLNQITGAGSLQAVAVTEIQRNAESPSDYTMQLDFEAYDVIAHASWKVYEAQTGLNIANNNLTAPVSKVKASGLGNIRKVCDDYRTNDNGEQVLRRENGYYFDIEEFAIDISEKHFSQALEESAEGSVFLAASAISAPLTYLITSIKNDGNGVTLQEAAQNYVYNQANPEIESMINGMARSIKLGDADCDSSNGASGRSAPTSAVESGSKLSKFVR
jgi:hypothetical protein